MKNRLIDFQIFIVLKKCVQKQKHLAFQTHGCNLKLKHATWHSADLCPREKSLCCSLIRVNDIESCIPLERGHSVLSKLCLCFSDI